MMYSFEELNEERREEAIGIAKVDVVDLYEEAIRDGDMEPHDWDKEDDALALQIAESRDYWFYYVRQPDGRWLLEMTHIEYDDDDYRPTVMD